MDLRPLDDKGLNFNLRKNAYFAVQHSESNNIFKLKYYFCTIKQTDIDKNWIMHYYKFLLNVDIY